MDSPSGNQSVPANIVKTLVYFYSSYLFERFLTLFLTSVNPNNFLSKVSNIYSSTKQRRRNSGLPLPLSPATTAVSPDQPSVITSEGHRVFEALQDIMEHTLQNLHNIQKNLRFWQSRAEGSDAQKAYFMLCERGPYAFLNGTTQLIHDYFAEGSGMQHVYHSASSYISERISVLTSLRYFLATFLAEVYMEVERVGDDLVKDLERSLPSVLVSINELFMKLEASIGHFHANRQSRSSVDGSYSIPLIFAKLPEVNQEGSQWTDCEIRDAINLIYQNLHRLDSYLSMIVSKHCKPRKVTLYWMRYSCGVIGISACSIWLLRHSKLMGSSDIDSWIREAKDSTISFWNDHVEQPLLSIRDELFETFRKRQKGAMEREEVQLTADSLHRVRLIAMVENGWKGIGFQGIELLGIVLPGIELKVFD